MTLESTMEKAASPPGGRVPGQATGCPRRVERGSGGARPALTRGHFTPTLASERLSR